MRTAPAAVLILVLTLSAGAGLAAETDDARDRLERILADPVFQLEEPEPGLTEKLMARVREFMFRLVNKISAAMELNAALVTVLLWTAIVLALLGAGWVIVRLTRDRFAVPGTGPTGSSPPAVRPDRVRSPEELLAGARVALASGNGRDVLRLCLQASILSLRAAGHLPDDRSMTDMEGARALERNGPTDFRKPFRVLARTHDRLVYAGRPAEGGELDQALVLAGGIVLGSPDQPQVGSTR